MSLNARDPQFGVKLTAYALGELDGKELKEVEEAVASNPSLQREVTAIREMVGTLTRELEREPAPGLTREQRARIAEGRPDSKVAGWMKNFWAGMTLTRLVPALAIGMIAFGYFGPFSTFLKSPDVNEPAFKSMARTAARAVTPEAKSQPAVPAVPAESTGVAKDVAPALKSEQAKNDERQDKGAAGPGSLAKESREGAVALGQAEGARRKSENLSGADSSLQALANRGTMTNAQPEPAAKPKVMAKMAPMPSKATRSADHKSAAAEYESSTADLDGAQAPPPEAAPAEVQAAPAPRQAAPAPKSLQRLQGALAGAESRGGARLATGIGTVSKGKEGAGAKLRGAYAEKKKAPVRAAAPKDDASRDEYDSVSVKEDSTPDNEAYDRVVDNEFKKVAQEPLSTFSIDVDTGSYSNLRRFITSGSLPPKDAVRVEELVNYFPYSYETPKKSSSDPFAVNVEINQAPWNPEHRLVRIGLKGRELENGKRPPSNLVFLIDVSGSMDEPNKLPWVTESLKMLSNQLGENDKVSIVVYAGNTGLLLPPTRGNHRKEIIDALEHMKAGGSTNGGQGIELAYKVARENFVQGGTNRVILCTDGDWNVGVTSQGDLTRLIEKKAKEGVFLSILGFGMGNLKDATMVKLADKGHGHYAYIDTLAESKKVLVEEIGSTLVTIAKDVKIQVEFNPAEVNAFRLIGYEKRIMAHEDFNDDTKDAGIIGAGHTVTALYEVVPAGKSIDTPSVDALKYQKVKEKSDAAKSGELMTLKLRYKAPEDGTSKLMSFPIKDEGKSPSQASKDFKFQSAIAAFAMLLRDSQYKGTTTYENVIDLAQSGKGDDKQGYRSEFIELVRKAKGFARVR